jgi:hypothetical protein
MNTVATQLTEQLCNNGGMQATAALKTLSTVLGNIVNMPGKDKYRTLRLDNPKVQEKIGRVAGAVDLLKALGTPRPPPFFCMPTCVPLHTCLHMHV